MAQNKIIKSYSDKEIELLKPIVDRIDHLRVMTAMMSDQALKDKRFEFQNRLAMGEPLDNLLVDAFAIVREATARVRHTPHYPVQLMGGIVLHQGRVAQMCTGEGKTQTVILPAYLNALEGKGVHVVTCNEYLSVRDADDLRPVYEALGMTVGSVTSTTPFEERKKAYECDITYVTNSELAFDYLRDNMAIYKEKQVLRDLHYCIIDEVDEVLIDQAKIPLNVSGSATAELSYYVAANDFVLTLEEGVAGEERTKLDYVFKIESKETGDYIVDSKNNKVNLTDRGIAKLEEYFGIENIADPENLMIRHNVNNALSANYLMERDVDYLVRDRKVLLVDKFTGRVIEGCRFGNGLQEALEAKEHLVISKHRRTIANITYQSFFNKFAKKGGLTGTGKSEETEFRSVYSMDVVVIPTNRPIQRIDHPDAVYRSKKEKLNALVAEVRKSAKKRQPVLIGTPSIEASEEVSELLNKEGISHRLLNAKKLSDEAEIVAQAGRAGSITVSTNMAGRGTDIKIDEAARAAGGLKVIGTERFESRRIDDQLRGRSGRQGDVGESQFIISLEDDLLRRFGSDRMIKLFDNMKFHEGHRIEHRSMTKNIDNAQHNVEVASFNTRKNTFEYDNILNDQREIIYEERNRILTHDNIHPTICRLIDHVVNDAVDRAIGDNKFDDWDYADLNSLLLPIIPLEPLTVDRVEVRDSLSLRVQLKLEALTLYEDKLEKFAQTQNKDEIEKVVLLKCIDSKWTRHIDDIIQLKQGIHLESYSGKKPIDQFKIMAYDMFDEMIDDIREDAIYILYHSKFGRDVKREDIAEIVSGIKITLEEEVDDIDGDEIDIKEKGKEKKKHLKKKYEHTVTIESMKPAQSAEELAKQKAQKADEQWQEDVKALVEAANSLTGAKPRVRRIFGTLGLSEDSPARDPEEYRKRKERERNNPNIVIGISEDHSVDKIRNTIRKKKVISSLRSIPLEFMQQESANCNMYDGIIGGVGDEEVTIRASFVINK